MSKEKCIQCGDETGLVSMQITLTCDCGKPTRATFCVSCIPTWPSTRQSQKEKSLKDAARMGREYNAEVAARRAARELADKEGE